MGITLQAERGHRHWTVYSDGETRWQTSQFVAEPGQVPVENFRSYSISEISSERILIELDKQYGHEAYELHPGETLVISFTVEGNESSDGCSYDGQTFTLRLTWEKTDLTN